MLKAVFVDYMGTTVQENSPEMVEVVKRICKNSELHDPKQVLHLIVNVRRQYEIDSYLSSYHTEDEIADMLLSYMVEQIHLKDDLAALHMMVQDSWVNAPLFPDTPTFFTECPLPIYVITNNGLPYTEEALRKNGLNVAGIVSSDTVKAYKPHRELFDEALRISNCSVEEAIHIGDSYATDVIGARSAGIRPLLVFRREQQQYDDVTMVKDLKEALDLIINNV